MIDLSIRRAAAAWICCAVVACALAPVASFGGPVRFEVLGDLPGGSARSESAGVSADGSAVTGTSFVAEPRELEAFRWTAGGGMAGLGVLPLDDAASGANGISGDGRTVVGRAFGTTVVEAFRWSKGTGIQGLGFLRPGDTYSTAQAVSRNGAFIVGASGSYDTQRLETFRWSAGKGMQALGFVAPQSWDSEAYGVSADGSVVVGESSRNLSEFEAFRWTERTGMVGLGLNSFARAVSADGRVVVGYAGRDAFRWTEEGGLVRIARGSDSASAVAFATSADGSIVVGEMAEQAFIWDEAHGVRDLGALLRASGALADFPHAIVIRATGISDDGTVVVGDARPLGNDAGDMMVFRATLEPAATAMPLPRGSWAGAAGLVLVALLSRFWRMGRHTRVYSDGAGLAPCQWQR